MSLINLESVSKYFNNFPKSQKHALESALGKAAVLEFTLQIEKGERVVLLGPSGCGKTTLLRMLAGFIPPDEGRIFLNGALVAEDGNIIKQPEERNIGMVFQDLALWPHLSVRGNIELGLKAHHIPTGERTERINEILTLVEMQNYINAKPAELSGGQQQRVASARALALRPQVLLMDEPLSNLDLELNIKLRKEIVKLQVALGFTLLYITHDIEEAVDIGTRIVIMRQGRIEQIGQEKEAREYFKRLTQVAEERSLL